MKDFYYYFFGKGENVEFVNFSFAHFLPILLMIGIIALIIIYKDKLKNFKYEEHVRLGLALTMIICEMSYFWRLVGVESLNPNPIDHLPITVCGWAVIFGSYMVVTKNKTLFDIVYFWVLGGSIFGLLTPTVITYTGPTRFRYYQFWIEHTIGFIAIFYMMFVHNMRPKLLSIVKSYGALVILGIVAIIANSMFAGANYLFLARAEETKSILDFLPENYVVRILIVASVVGLLFFVMYLPFFIKDRKSGKIIEVKE